MDIDYLLIILPSIIFLGVFGLILIIWHGNFRQKKEAVKLTTDISEKKSAQIINHASQLSRREPTLNELSQTEIKPKQAVRNFMDNFIILQVIAPKDRPYRGYELIQTLNSAGFHYGKMNIFHYYASISAKKETLFSLASAIEPGTFDLDHIGEIVCPGLCLFMSLNKVKSPLTTFDLMLETTHLLIQDLGGILCDKQLQALALDDLTPYYAQLHTYA